MSVRMEGTAAVVVTSVIKVIKGDQGSGLGQLEGQGPDPQRHRQEEQRQQADSPPFSAPRHRARGSIVIRGYANGSSRCPCPCPWPRSRHRPALDRPSFAIPHPRLHDSNNEAQHAEIQAP